MPVDSVYGLHTVRALLEQDPAGVLELWIQDSRRDAAVNELRALAAGHGLAVQDASRKTLDRLCAGETHQGVVARYRSAPPQSADLESLIANLPEAPLVLALDAVLDPRNLGACVRSADAAGASAVIISRNRSVGLTAAARKVASGAAESVPVIEVSNLVRALVSLKAQGLMLIGATGDARGSLYELDLSAGAAFVMGGEEKGLRRLSRETCDQLVRIPMHGRVESLNVSVATGVCLFEARRQISASSGRKTA